MDESYQVYINRVARMTLPEAYRSQVQHIQASPKFQRHNGGYRAAAFPGYSVITPPSVEDGDNATCYQQLHELYQVLSDRLSIDQWVPLPPDSFHMTLADLIWDSAYRHADEQPDFQDKLQICLKASFEQCRPQVEKGYPAHWQVLGLIVMPRALGVCLAPKDEESYNRILHLRRAIYQNPTLIGLGIDQQYHFTAHITLGYFGEAMAETERNSLSTALTEINDQWLAVDSKGFAIHHAELRKFDDMTRYYREPTWAVLDF
ncbi:MAG: DUF1868 domain-containing protein [Leptolyngbyaceae cyanobacterium SL_7_1]|nr:DUF1868 domain-containing protein [Leptolyngbyaceae cyanobacterium SL_7_1]